jgi:hypothetical protein
VPPYQVQLVLSGGRRVEPQHVERFPRFGPRPESAGPALPSGSPVFGGGSGSKWWCWMERLNWREPRSILGR